MASRAHNPVLGRSRAQFIWLLFLFFSLHFLGAFAWAQNPQPASAVDTIDIHAQFKESKIGRSIALYEDPGGNLTFDQIRSPEIAAQFVPSSQDSPSFGYTQSAYWAHFQLNDLRSMQDAQNGEVRATQRQDDWVLLLAYAQTDVAELWCTNATGATILHQRAGDHVPRTEWPTNYREPAFMISESAQNCWLRVQSSASMQFPLTLYTEDAFTDKRLTDNALQALYFGSLLVMLIYNAILAVSTRSLAYTYYSLFLLGYALFQCAFGGLGYALLWPFATGQADFLIPSMISFMAISSLLFAIVLLDLRQHARRWFIASQVVTGLFVCTLPFPLLASYSMSVLLIFILAPLWVLILLGSGTYLAWRGMRVAKIYIAAWFVFIMGVVVIIASRLGWLPVNGFTANATQIGSAIEFILLSFALVDRIKTTQAALLRAQQEITHNLRTAEQLLNEKVELRTAELKAANVQTTMTLRLAESAKERAVAAQRQAEQAREETALAMAELQESQAKLLAAEKMASLGLLVSNVAHEINTPNSAVQSSSVTVANAMRETLQNMPRLLDSVSPENRVLFLQLVLQFDKNNEPLSTREERQITKQMQTFLDHAGIDGAIRKARLMVKLRAHAQLADYLPLLSSDDGDFILSAATGVVDVLNGTQNIQTASAKISRIVGSLKELSGNDRTLALFENHLYQCMERAIATLESKLQDLDVVRNYQDMAPLRCDHESMQQAFSHLLVNAAQSMEHRGAIMIGMRTVNNQAEVRITDFGSGIAAEIRDRIFEPFFTTRTAGEGGGMGLALVKKVIEQHNGQIEVQTEVGFGTTITLTLPYGTAANE
jgi:signal transduction histidine kinase